MGSCVPGQDMQWGDTACVMGNSWRSSWSPPRPVRGSRPRLSCWELLGRAGGWPGGS